MIGHAWLTDMLGITGGAPAGTPNPALGSVIAQNPEAVVPQLAAQGVMPPDLTTLQPQGAAGSGFSPLALGNMPGTPAMPAMPGSPANPQSAALPTPSGTPQGVGGAEQIPLPRPRPQDAQASAPTGAGGQQSNLLDAMRGVKAPAAPETQKISSPAAPRPTGLAANPQLLQLIAQGMQGGGPQPSPLYLGRALGAGRY